MKTYIATTTISATPQKIWSILTDADNYPNWDPGMIRIEGKIAPGERVKFFTHFSPDRAFAVKITAFEPSQKMIITGGLPLGLFKSERTHTLTDLGNGQTRFETIELFSGLLLPLFGRQIPDLTENFNNFAAALKQQAEQA